MAASSTLKQHAYRYLRERIILGQITPGTRLKEEVISRETGVSRGPIREAIRQLDSEGIVRHITHQGATVHAPTQEEVQELIELRASIESGVAARAAQRAAPWVLDLLNREVLRVAALVKELEASRPTSFDETTACALAGADLRFHGVLMEVAASPRAIKILRDLRVLSFIWDVHPINFQADPLTIANLTLTQHTAVYEAIRDRNSNLARVEMMNHLIQSQAHATNAAADAARVSLIQYKPIRDLLLAFESQNQD